MAGAGVSGTAAERSTAPLLVVFVGLPGVGKTTLARRIADHIGATFLRIDTIETAVLQSGTAIDQNPLGYLVAIAVAADQLRAGRPVVGDAVNNLRIARQGWREVAVDTRSNLRLVEVVCSDAAEHRRRVESRCPDVPGASVPSWDAVRSREWEPVRQTHLTIDNLGDPDERATAILDWLT